MALGASGPATAAATGLLLLVWDPPLAPGTPLPPAAVAVSGPYPIAVVRTLPWPDGPPGAAFRVAVEVADTYCGPIRVSLAADAALALLGAGGRGVCGGMATAAITYERVCDGGAGLWAAAPAAGVELLVGSAASPRCLPRTGE